MEQKKSITLEVPSIETIREKRSYPTGLFAVALVFFFFNFCEMSCQGRRFAAVTGLQLATGSEIKSPEQSNPFGFGPASESPANEIPANLWAALALIAAATGLTVFLMKRSNENKIGLAVGAIGVVSLLILNVTLRQDIRAQGNGVVQISFLMPYWISLLSLAGAGYVCKLRMTQENVMKSKSDSTPLKEPENKHEAEQPAVLAASEMNFNEPVAVAEKDTTSTHQFNEVQIKDQSVDTTTASDSPVPHVERQTTFQPQQPTYVAMSTFKSTLSTTHVQSKDFDKLIIWLVGVAITLVVLATIVIELI